MKAIRNKVGLEAEYFLYKDGKLVFPGSYGFDTDDFALIGEFRADPGDTRESALANFFVSYFGVIQKAKRLGLTVEFKSHEDVSPAMYSEAMRRMGTKEISKCDNIYGTDMMSLSDAVVESGELKFHRVSCGLHIHFSSDVSESETIRSGEYAPFELPLNIGGVDTSIRLFKKVTSMERKIKVSASCITKPVINHIVSNLDKELLLKYMKGINVELKYRRPGWYEVKSDGRFEYRSLPFTDDVISDIVDIVDFAFNQLDEI